MPSTLIRPVLAVFAALVELVLPRACAGCGRSGSPLCAECRPSEQPVHVWAGGLDVCASGAYEGPLRAALLDYKERGRSDLSGPLGQLLARAVGVALESASDVVLVPVPSTSAARRARGGDHVRRLARVAAAAHGLAVAAPLSYARTVEDSAGLSRVDRAANLRGAMLARPPAGPRVAVLVDDIVTTGATVREARRALRIGRVGGQRGRGGRRYAPTRDSSA